MPNANRSRRKRRVRLPDNFEIGKRRKKRSRLVWKRRSRLVWKRKAKLDWEPRWEPEISGWAFHEVCRVRNKDDVLNSVDDLMQDAYCLYLKLVEHYPRVTEPRHFMALYKTSFRNMYWTKLRVFKTEFDHLDRDFDWEQGTLVDSDISELSCLINNGPPELKLFLSVFQDPEKLEKLREKTKEGERKLNLNEKISKILGIRHFPFFETFKEYLQGT